MKLSEALVLRADIQKRLLQLRSRLRASALVQEGEQPDENPGTLLAELDQMLNELRDLIARINHTNVRTAMADGRILTDVLAERDVLKERIGILRELADAASGRVDRYSRSEIRNVATVDVGALRRQVDDLSRQYRDMDTAIQATNWATELAE